jgi:hypothetical protein
MTITANNIKTLFIAALLLVCGKASAQIELAAGIDLVYPILVNKYNEKISYQQFGGGGHLGISYKPELTQFFPTLNMGLGATKLPVSQFGDNVVVANISYWSTMLNGNIVATLRNDNTIYFLTGIGFSRINQRFISVAGPRGDAMKVQLDSLKNESKYFPAAGLGIEYVYGNSVNTSLYISMGLYCQYILLFQGRNEYFTSVRDLQGNDHHMASALTGGIFFPSAYLSLHYLLGDNIIFWKHK